ncbi:MAG: HAD-IIIC family phosphatase [Isosphaeraceae bacterium]
MTDTPEQFELLEQFAQLDGPARATEFKAFLHALAALAAESGDRARGWAARAVSPTLDYSALMKLRRYLAPGPSAGSSLRLAILGGPTTTQLRQLIEVFLAGAGMDGEIYEADYGLFRQEILTPGSGLDRFQPTFVFLATGARDVARRPGMDHEEDAVARLAALELADWAHLWETANARWNAIVLQNNFEIAPGGVLGHHALRHPAAWEHYLERLNRLLADRAPSYVVLHDQRGLAAEAGARDWFDPRFYLEFKMPCGPECLVAYAHSVVSLVRAAVGRSKKARVLDLDNPLWGGRVGDLGAGGIRLGQGSGEGEAFVAFQRYAKELRERGILLAVCSKNDEDKAREPFEKREDMVLRLADFSCFIANWENKVDNLREIAERLDLKLDSFVFVDDNPAERAVVRRFLPEVAVPDLPEDPAGFIQALALHRYFETIALTSEDAARARYYAENARRKDLAARTCDLTSFLASLEMRMKVEPVSDLNIERVTQLLNKSNQFNLTTRRYTLPQVREIAAAADWRTLTFSLKDKLGDNGLISVILLRKKDQDSLVIDTWVMSCRVLQRGVEEFARNELVELAREEGRARILGTYIPTSKNSMVEHHYARLGFEPDGSDGARTFWCLSSREGLQPMSHFIERETAHG